MGQWLTVPMILIGLYMIATSFRRDRDRWALLATWLAIVNSHVLNLAPGS